MAMVGRRGKQADEVTAFTTRGRVQRTPLLPFTVQFLFTRVLLEPASRMKERMWVVVVRIG